MDASQDVLLDWSYPHPGAAEKSEPIHREWFRDRWRSSFTKKTNKKFFEILQRKSRELTGYKILTYVVLGNFLIRCTHPDPSAINMSTVIALGFKASEALDSEEAWAAFLNRLSCSLSKALL